MPRFIISEWQTLNIPVPNLSEAQRCALLEMAEQKTWFSVEWSHLKPDVMRLKGQNFVGQCVIPVVNDEPVEVVILPKVPIDALMGWWCWSEQALMPSDHLIRLNSITDILEQICGWLAHGVLRLVQRGLLTEYVRQESFLSNIRGQISVSQSLPAFYRGKPELYCRYDQRTVDIPDNQILLWTLHQARKWPFRHKEVRHVVNQAYRHLSGGIGLQEVSAQSYFNRSYTRLNRHYQPLHQWCGMILNQLTLSEQMGEQVSPTFMLELSRVFEQAVANYLRQHLTYPYEVIPQCPYRVSSAPDISFQIDIVIRDQVTGQTLAVLDTKYKDEENPSRHDVFQIVSYATSQDCQEGALIYPIPIMPIEASVGPVRLRNLYCDMFLPMERAGRELIESLEDLLERTLPGYSARAC
jgi:5-methylcytosine-specific restriction enzyme subunit McrC